MEIFDRVKISSALKYRTALEEKLLQVAPGSQARLSRTLQRREKARRKKRQRDKEKD